MNLPIVFSLDDNYLYPTLVFLFCATKHADDQCRFVLAHDPEKLSAQNVEFLTSFSRALGQELEVFEIPTTSAIRIGGHVTSVTYARLMMLDLFKESFIWLDVDLLPLAGWQEIFDAIDREEPAYATSESIRRAYDQNRVISRPAATKINRARERVGARYFNAGVMYLNTDKWGEINAEENWHELLTKADEYGFQYADQCILNYLFAETFKDLPKELNANADTSQLVGKAKILHFDGPIKPWQTRRNLLFNVRNDPAKQIWLQTEKEFAYFNRTLGKNQRQTIRLARRHATIYGRFRQLKFQLPSGLTSWIRK